MKLKVSVSDDGILVTCPLCNEEVEVESELQYMHPDFAYKSPMLKDHVESHNVSLDELLESWYYG